MRWVQDAQLAADEVGARWFRHIVARQRAALYRLTQHTDTLVALPCSWGAGRLLAHQYTPVLASDLAQINFSLIN